MLLQVDSSLPVLVVRRERETYKSAASVPNFLKRCAVVEPCHHVMGLPASALQWLHCNMQVRCGLKSYARHVQSNAVVCTVAWTMRGWRAAAAMRVHPRGEGDASITL